MSIHLRTHAKSKSVLISGISAIIGAAYRYLDLWSNLSFFVERLQDGTVKSVLGFFVTERGANVMFFVTITFFVLALLFEVRRTERSEGQAGHWHQTPEYDLTAQEKQSVAAKVSTQEKQAARIIVDVTPAQLTGLFEGHTAIQGSKLVEPYIGKWMQVVGVVAQVRGYEQGAEVFLIMEHGEDRFTQVTADFKDERFIDRLRVLKSRSTLTVLGQIARVDSAEVVLHNCEIVSHTITEATVRHEGQEGTSSIKPDGQIAETKPEPNLVLIRTRLAHIDTN